jgi:molecular chaperone DnaK
MGKSIGIDLGTTNSCVSYFEGESCNVIPSVEGSRIFPSIVAVDNAGNKIYSNIARRQFVSNPKNTIWGAKRLIGRMFDSKEVKQFKKSASYLIVEGSGGKSRIRMGNRIYSPEEISGYFLRFLRKRAEDYLQDEVDNAVITVPAFFNDNQRQSTKIAGEIADLKVQKILNEPTAALIAYRDRITEDGIYAVYDLGGGTFDISIVEVKNDVHKVISTSGDTFLGGCDFDDVIVDWILQQIIEEIQVDLSNRLEIMQRIRMTAERIKIELSFKDKAVISLPHFYQEGGNVYNFNKVLTKEKLEQMTEHLVYRTLNIVKEAFDEIGIKPELVIRLVLVGGQSRMPLIAELLGEYFKKEPFKDLNPEEVVSIGAATQAEIISGRLRQMVLLDVTPLSIGVETKGDVFHRVIPRNSTIPIRRSEVFSTTSDDQTNVKIHILQGERAKASKNISLGELELYDIEKAPKGVPKIDVSFNINSNGIVKVTAKDKKSGKLQSIKMRPSAGLTRGEVEKIKSEAMRYEEEDRKFVEIKAVKDAFFEEFNIIQTSFSRFSDKLKASHRKEIAATIKKIKRSQKIDDIKILKENLALSRKIRNELNEVLSISLKKKR